MNSVTSILKIDSVHFLEIPHIPYPFLNACNHKFSSSGFSSLLVKLASMKPRVNEVEKALRERDDDSDPMKGHGRDGKHCDGWGVTTEARESSGLDKGTGARSRVAEGDYQCLHHDSLNMIERSLKLMSGYSKVMLVTPQLCLPYLSFVSLNNNPAVVVMLVTPEHFLLSCLPCLFLDSSSHRIDQPTNTLACTHAWIHTCIPHYLTDIMCPLTTVGSSLFEVCVDVDDGDDQLNQAGRDGGPSQWAGAGQPKPGMSHSHSHSSTLELQKDDLVVVMKEREFREGERLAVGREVYVCTCVLKYYFYARIVGR